jgi:putative NIF3 family GTP cyclohydrolase 1 type 2
VARLQEIISYLDELLEAPDFPDYGPNGLQVPGAEEVTVVASGVSAHLDLFERAAAAGAQLVIAHHGLFWDFHPRSLSPTMKERLRVLFDNDIALAGYHLPLDAHPEVGNNALICVGLGLERAEPFGEHRGRSVGFVGCSARSRSAGTVGLTSCGASASSRARRPRASARRSRWASTRSSPASPPST